MSFSYNLLKAIEVSLLLNLLVGLFHRAWAESGSALDPWVLEDRRTRLESTQLIKHLNCNVEDVKTCMKSKSAEDIIKYTLVLYQESRPPPFGPVVEEQNDNNPHPFLVRHPYEQLKAGKLIGVPFIMSQSSAEGLGQASGN